MIIDGHCDTLWRLLANKQADLATPSEGHLDLPGLVKGGVVAQLFAVYIEPEYKPDRALHRALQYIDCFYRQMENCQGISLVRNAHEIRENIDRDVISAVLALEGGEPILDLECLRVFHRLGVRSIGLTWNQRNHIADGVAESGTGGRLSSFGVRLVGEMNRLGIMVDVSHISEPGFWHVIEISKRPVVATHSNCKSLCAHRRNLSDEQLAAIGRSGGVVGITMPPDFVSSDPEAADVDRLVDHIEHALALAGESAVGLGSDFDGTERLVKGISGVADYPRVLEAMKRRGFSDELVEKVAWKNWLSVMEAAWGEAVMEGAGDAKNT